MAWLVASLSYASPFAMTRQCSHEELLHVQDKRSSSKIVGAERGRQRTDRLKPQSEKTSQSDTWTIALSSLMKLNHAMQGHPRWMGHGGEV